MGPNRLWGCCWCISGCGRVLASLYHSPKLGYLTQWCLTKALLFWGHLWSRWVQGWGYPSDNRILGNICVALNFLVFLIKSSNNQMKVLMWSLNTIYPVSDIYRNWITTCCLSQQVTKTTFYFIIALFPIRTSYCSLELCSGMKYLHFCSSKFIHST